MRLVVIGAISMIAGVSSDRVEVMARIDDGVHAIATALEQPSPHMIDDAKARGREVRDLLAQLATLKANDARAADMLAHYPKYADKVDGALGHLSALLAAVHRADGLAARCEQDECALHDLLAQTAKHPNAPAQDLAALTAKATDLKVMWGPVLAKLSTIDASIKSEVAGATVTLTDGWWMSIATTLATDAQAEAATWNDAYAAAVPACEALTRGTDREDVAPVLEALRKRGAANESAGVQIVRDYNAWLASVRELRTLALETRDRMHESLCAPTDSSIGDGAGAIAVSAARDLADRATSAAAEMARLKLHADDNPAKSKAILDGIQKTGAVVTAIERDEALGRENPRFKAVLAELHRRRDRAITACSARGVEVDGSTIECVKLVDHTCTVVEAAPDTEAARADAFARGKREHAALQAWYGRDKAGLFAHVPTMKKCDVNGALQLFTDVATYAACPAAPATSLGEPLGAVSPEL